MAQTTNSYVFIFDASVPRRWMLWDGGQDIAAGSLETEATFTPPLKINSISGLDKAVLVDKNLRLNVSVDLQYVSID